MSAQDRYTKIIESLVNGEEAKASELLHEAFVEKAREIWSDLVEQDEIIEDEIAEEELEEDISDEEAGDFLDDIESAEDEIDAEEAYESEEEDEEMLEPEAEMELASDEEEHDHDFDDDGELDDHEEDHEEIEDKLMSVEDALADLKAEFAKVMGDQEPEAEEMEESTEQSDEVEELEEAAELKSVGNVAMPDGSDGKDSPVGPGLDDPFKGKGANTEADPVDFAGGNEKGGKAPAAKDMGVRHPGEGADLKPENRGHGAEKKGKAE